MLASFHKCLDIQQLNKNCDNFSAVDQFIAEFNRDDMAEA